MREKGEGKNTMSEKGKGRGEGRFCVCVDGWLGGFGVVEEHSTT